MAEQGGNINPTQVNQNTGPKYKFKDLKVHGNAEWLSDGKRKYRQVFDVNITKYIYYELSIYNFLFDKDDWNISVLFKVTDQNGTEKCSETVTQPVMKTDNVAFIKYSWGLEKPGTYWFKGAYKIEAWVDGALLGTKNFYMLGEGEIQYDCEPYFRLSTVKLYEGPGADVPFGKREYLKSFAVDKTRYLWIEIEGDNLQYQKVPWQGEFFIRIRNSNSEMITEIVDFYTYENTIDRVRFVRGWGSEAPGTWYRGNYEIDIVLMERLLGKVLFSVGDTDEPDLENGKVLVPGAEGFVYSSASQQPSKPKEQLTEEEIMKEMNQMIGLETIKESLRDKYDYLKFLKVRKDKGIDDVDEKIGLHSVFTGNPGTGKTKTALLLGKIYYNLGLLSKGHVYEVDRTDLVGEYVGQTAPKTKEAIKKAKGGILFIDEAYSLAREGDTQRDFGREVIEIVLKEMSDGDGDLAVVVAGYPDEMEHFLDSNPGLKSRFNSNFTFPDYNPKELLAIGEQTAKQLDVELDKESDDYLYTKLVEVYRDRDRTFGNARYVNSIIGEAKMNLGLRVIDSGSKLEEVDDKTLSTVTLDDIKEIFRKKEHRGTDIPPDEELLKDSLNELNKLIGIENIKTDIHEMVKLVRYYRDIGKDVTKSFSLHTVFTGNPGTGKTTVARIMARLFRALGVLERGHLVECDREGLVAGYVGQTAIKTSAKIEEAKGGVLFIDEAYALAQQSGSEWDFGKEAIEVILKRMEDNRGEFVVICAGYPDEMEQFLKSNPGLKSRFDRRFDFKDYNADELFAIAQVILKEQELVMDTDAAEHFKKYIASICSGRDKFFGNAREIRKALGEAVKNQNLRLAEMTKEQRTKDMISTVTLKDVEELPTEIKQEKPKLGFEA